jgi:hypothetical protein
MKKLYGLSKRNRPSESQWKHDFDYIQKLEAQARSKNELLSKEAKEALEFLNGYALAEYDSNFKALNEITDTSIEFKRNLYQDRYASKQCVLNKKDEVFSFQQESDLFEAVNLGDARELLQRKKSADKRISKATKNAISKEVA